MNFISEYGMALLLGGGGLIIALVVLLVYLLASMGRLKHGEEMRQQEMRLIMEQSGRTLAKELQSMMQTVNTSVDNKLTNVQGLIDKRLADNSALLEKRLDINAKSMERTRESVDQRLRNVTETLTGLEVAQQRIVAVGKDILELQDILKAPKLRGGFGEFLLADFLAQILPAEHVKTQYRFSTGEIVDAVIILRDGMVPVDAKFPMENFRKYIGADSDEEKKRAKKTFVGDVKKQVDEISEKYIRTDEGTFAFALMYIPAENIYYETIIRDEDLGGERSLLNYALAKNVIPVSPNSFYAYLQAIALGLKGMRIEEHAREMLGHLDRLKGDFTKFREDFEVLGTHLKNARNKYDDAGSKLGRFEDRLDDVGALGQGEPPAIEES
ncbi:MAG: DNA recombination protein RmuC [Deltaproteobacteria bacterium]|nr:DNA recombination protein RmuC [Candidatus Zymogenaceae bacterium]